MENTEHAVWETEARCKYCDTRFIVTANDVIFGDLRPPDLFVADMQYYAKCSNCNGNYIVTELPSHVSIWIQNKMFTPK